jgi:hypothetical protein
MAAKSRTKLVLRLVLSLSATVLDLAISGLYYKSGKPFRIRPGCPGFRCSATRTEKLQARNAKCEVHSNDFQNLKLPTNFADEAE